MKEKDSQENKTVVKIAIPTLHQYSLALQVTVPFDIAVKSKRILLSHFYEDLRIIPRSFISKFSVDITSEETHIHVVSAMVLASIFTRSNI